MCANILFAEVKIIIFEGCIQKVNTMFRMSMISPFDVDHPESRDDFVINIEDSTNHMEVSSI